MATTDFDNNSTAKESETIIKQGESNVVEFSNNEIRSLSNFRKRIASYNCRIDE